MESNTLTIALTMPNEQVAFMSTVPDKADTITTRYAPDAPADVTLNPMELFLISFLTCSCTSLVTLLRDRMRVTVHAMAAQAKGHLRAEHPKAFDVIEVHYTLHAPELTDAKMERALHSVEEKICPVWTMIRGNVRVETTYEIKA